MPENLLSGESSQTSPATGRLNHPDDIKKHFSSKTYRERLLDKDNIVVACTLLMDGKDFLWTSSYEVAINQKTNEHDEFTITVPDDALDSFEGYLMENSKNILGNGVTIKFHQYGEITQTFEGFITKIKNKKENGYGFLEIIGNSPTIFLESGLRSRSFENQTLEQIIAEVCRGGRGEGKISVQKPQHTASIPYTVQYLESNYAFVQRLAKLYGEYFYYNGSTIIFGNAVQPIITLEDTIELMELETEITTKPQHFGFTAYDSESGGTAEAGSHRAGTQYKENPFLHTGMNASKKMYTDKAESHYNPAGLQNADGELGDAARRERENRENLVTVHGKSSSPKLRVGGRARLVDINGHAMETYRILEVRHYHDGNEYYNEFVGIPDLFNAPYQDNFALPLGEAQPARVLDNNDPMGMGRLRVQFPWQVKSGEKTPWIRLVQPHSGSGKGFHFIPEIGEEVMVGFEGGNLQKPFVMGTHYNGAETSGYHTSDNSIKAVRTRSGIETVSNDAEGSWRQSTPDGNFIFQDGNGNTVMNAPKDFTINVGGNFYVNVGQSMSFLVGMKAIYNIGMQMLMNTPILKYLVSDNYHLQSPKTLINGEKEIKIESKETSIVGYDKLFAHSDETAIINSKGTVAVKGQEGTSHTNVADAVVKELPVVDTKCIVHFRPQAEWKGEFGFCFYREKNDEIIDSEEFERLVGKYYQFTNRELTRISDARFNDLINKYYNAEQKKKLGYPVNRALSTTFIELYIKDPNKWYKHRQKVIRSNEGEKIIEKFADTIDVTIENFKNDPQFKPTNDTLQNLRDEYSNFIYNKIKEQGKKKIITPVVYYSSYIALFPKTANYGVNEANIDLKINFLNNEKPDYLIFKVDGQELKADHFFIGITPLKIDNPREKETIKISCKTAENFTSDKIIEIYAVKKQGEIIVETKAGCITMIAPKVRTLNVVKVGVKTKVTAIGIPPQYGQPTNNWQNTFKKVLGQFLIKVNVIEKIGEDPINIDISAHPHKNTLNITDGAITNHDELDDILNSQFVAEHEALNENNFKLYFLDLPSTTENGSVAGYAEHGNAHAIMFSMHTHITIPHEILHAMDLPHSFYHYKSSYVFRAMETNNIMDYSHLTSSPFDRERTRTPKERYLTWYWQWKKVWKYFMFNNQ